MMLGENAQHKFDLYFHWYNIMHEYGHCLLDFHKHDSCGVLQEMLVNQFAVSYWKARGFQDSLNELRAMLEVAGVAHPEVCVEIADDPSQHFCRPV